MLCSLSTHLLWFYRQGVNTDPAEFGFQTYSPPDNITLNPTNKKTDLISLSAFQTGTGALFMSLLIQRKLFLLFIQLPLNRVLMDGLFVAEVHELFTKICVILDSALSKWAGNKACILGIFF